MYGALIEGTQNMWQYRTDTAKNRLYITIDEGLDAAHARLALRGIVRAMNLLKPGFAVVAEVLCPWTRSDPMVGALRALEEAGQEYGAERIVYVPGLGEEQGEGTAEGSGGDAQPPGEPHHSLEADQAASVAEAERLLEEPSPQRISAH